MGPRRGEASDVDAIAPTVADGANATPTVALRRTPASSDGAAPERATPDATLTAGGRAADAPARAFAADFSERARYALVSELARGGGGRIAIAIDRKLGRKVALKRPLDRDGEERLEREALVLARLEHPAIVPIHDAGHDAEGNPYYTMKLLGGATLADRIAACGSFDERLGLLAAVTTVADAVAYAHSQRVIHRDLKPGNVLVGDFGEVALIDWGLGKIVGDPGELASSHVDATISAELTGHGAVVGTPAYMAPEQAVGDAVDERADVYALGAMLYHVLSGDVPYGRSGSQETLVQLVEGPPAPIEDREPRVPRDLAAIVGKAMARAPGDRYPSGRELAEDLHRYQTGRLVAAHRYKLRTRAWRWTRRRAAPIAAAIAVVAVGVAGVAIATSGGATIADETCSGLDAPARAAWGPDARAAAERAFAATGLPYASSEIRTIGDDLDRRAARIGAMRVEACRDARVIRSQPAEVMDLRMQCLDRRVSELGALAGVLATADAEVVAHADRAVASLGRVEDCADVARLRDRVPLPDDPRRRAEIAGVEAELDRLQALDDRGRYAEQVGRAPAAVLRALATGYAPVYARALHRYAALLADHDHDDEAAALFRIEVTVADAGRDDVARGRALDGLVRIEADHREHFDVGAEYARQALAVAGRTGDTDLETEVEIYLAHIAAATDHLDDAVAHDERAVAIQRAHPGSGRIHAEFDLGSEYVEVRRLDDGLRVLRGVVAEERAHFGTDLHPDVASALANIAGAEYEAGDVEHAIADQRHVIEIESQVRAPGSRETIISTENLATMIDGSGRHAEAEASLRALLPSTEARLGPTHSLTVSIVQNLAKVLDHEDHVDDALAMYRDAYARAAKVDPSSIDATNARSDIAGMLIRQHRDREALPELEAVLALQSKQTGADGYDATYTRADLGRALFDTGDAARAIVELRRALAVIDAQPDLNEEARGLYRSILAQALWATGERDAARAMAREALAILDRAGDDGAQARDDLVKWMKSVGIQD